MIRTLATALVALASISTASVVSAKEYVDYTYTKGTWRITAVEVVPAHVDDYLSGLRKSQVPGFEVMKRRGLIDEYHYAVRDGYSKGSPNVLIEVHFTNYAALEPDKARDEAIDKEIRAQFSEEAGKAAVAGYEKYRQQLETGYWNEVVMAK